MFPILRDEDKVVINPKFNALKRGDIIVLQTKTKIFIHRIIGIKNFRNKLYFITKGDNNWYFDSLFPFQSEQIRIIGKANAVIRMGNNNFNLEPINLEDKIKYQVRTMDILIGNFMLWLYIQTRKWVDKYEGEYNGLEES